MKQESEISLITSGKIISLVEMHAKEGLQLAFKSHNELLPVSEKKLNKLVCDVCAFANTTGGTIIFGIEKKRGKAEKFAYNESELFPLGLIQNTLETQIHKKVENLSVALVQTGVSASESVLVIHVPESKDAPHLASDHIFYKRHQNKSVPMEEYEIRIGYGKLSRTSLEFVGIFNTNGIPTLSNGKFTSVMFLPRFIIRNTGSVIEKYFKFEIGIPASLCDDSYYALNTYFSRHEGIHNVYSIPCKTPLFQDEMHTISEAKLLVTNENISDYLSQNIFVTLFFSSGVKSTEFSIVDLFKYNDKVLQADEFLQSEG